MNDSATVDGDLPFLVGDWRVDPQNNELQHGDHIIKLEPKVMDVLIYLAMHPGQVVSRTELEQHVWSGRVVTYDALTATIVKLRKAFQCDGQGEPVIKTISKRGYCLVAPIHQSSADAIAIQVVDTTPAPPSHTETQAQPESVEAKVLPDSIQRSALTLRLVLLLITVVLIIGLGIAYQTMSPSQRTTVDSQSVNAQHTQMPSTMHGGTTDLEAKNSFNAGWQKFRHDTPTDYKEAIALIQRAILLDPDYGQAHAALAAIYWNTWKRSWHILVGTAPIPHTLELADSALQRAMQHPTPLAYQVSSEMLAMNRRYDQAIKEAQKAIALAPNNPTGYVALANVLVFAGQPKQAKTNIDKAMQLNPYHPPPYLFTLGLIYFNTDHYDKAAAVLEQALHGNPQDHLIYVPLIAADGQLHRVKQAAPLIHEANRLRKLCQLPLLNVSLPIDPYPYNPWPFNKAEDVTRLQTGLRAAGLPEY